MRKSDKKLENKLREVLTEVCETALKRFDGFEWLTHETNYKNFPNSLRITCVFDTNTNLDLFRASSASTELSRLIQKKLFEIDTIASISPVSISFLRISFSVFPVSVADEAMTKPALPVAFK